MIDEHRKSARAELITEVTRAVREELRVEQLHAGHLLDPPWHWGPSERSKLVHRLREAADEIDPPTEAT